ncbi:MAG: metal-dependent transcriptional regulator [Lachnospiraceae bacterium]|nr:metal-dependent transcriptional regulator [Lachnospiraceae bacterium]
MKKGNSAEAYLESILTLHREKGYARSVDIAKDLGVTKPTVCGAMKRLREKRMIKFGEKGCILFTEAGKVIAERAYKRHTMLAKALIGIGVNKANAAKEACNIEHAISDETYECLNDFFRAHLVISD